jgi:flagella basal body P-ring formation protein FlgA
MSQQRHQANAAATRILGSIVFVFFIALTLATHVSATELRPNLTVTDSVVRLGDLFTDAGEKSETVLFEAPLPGKYVQISAFELTKIATSHGLNWQKPDYLKRVKLNREGTLVSADDIKAVIQTRLGEENLSGNNEVRIFGLRKGIYIPVDNDIFDIEAESLEISDRQDRFTAVLNLPVSDAEFKQLRITGAIEQVLLLPVLNRLVAPGEIIEAEDLSWENISAKRINGRSIRNEASVVGFAARRPLQPGKMLMSTDLDKPMAVEKGSKLTVVLSSGLMTLTASARALEGGGIGETIRVMNLKSKQTVEAVITSAGMAKISHGRGIALAGR